MSRGGRKAKSKEDEVQDLIAEAAAKFEAAEARRKEEERFALQQREILVYSHCKNRIAGPYLALWPGDALGAYIANEMLRQMAEAMMVTARARMQEVVPS